MLSQTNIKKFNIFLIYLFRFLCNCNTVTINSLIEVGQFRQVLEIFTDILIAISIDLEIGQHHYNAIFERFDIQNVFCFPLYIPLINIDKLVYYVAFQKRHFSHYLPLNAKSEVLLAILLILLIQFVLPDGVKYSKLFNLPNVRINL
jgi:hypothetical protein